MILKPLKTQFGEAYRKTSRNYYLEIIFLQYRKTKKATYVGCINTYVQTKIYFYWNMYVLWAYFFET